VFDVFQWCRRYFKVKSKKHYPVYIIYSLTETVTGQIFLLCFQGGAYKLIINFKSADTLIKISWLFWHGILIFLK